MNDKFSKNKNYFKKVQFQFLKNFKSSEIVSLRIDMKIQKGFQKSEI